MKQILLFGYGDQEAAACAVIRGMGYQPRVVQAEEMDQTIGFLCGLPGFRMKKVENPEPVHPGALMIFHDLSREELEDAMRTLRAEGITVASVKAMVTPTNQQWTMRHLGNEVREEQEVMAVLIRLRRLRSQMPMPNPADLEAMRAVIQAEQLLSGTREVTLEQAREAERNLLAVAGR